MHELIGKKILALYVDSGESGLLFRTDAGLVEYQAEADENAESWFSDITGVNALLGATVTDAVMRELPDMVDTKRCRGSVEDFFGIKLTTTKGYVDIVFRNSSNGYYGGHLGGASFPLESRLNWEFREITDDWQA